MHILLTDETNRRPSKDAKFFVYGGLLFPVEVLTTLHTAVKAIRSQAGYRAADELKFDTRARPPNVTIEAATEVKRRVIALAQRTGCKFIVHVILHDIIANQNAGQQIRWAADYVIGRFNQYLQEVNDDGICIVDNLPDRSEFKYLSNKFTHGLTLDTGKELALDRIKLFASTCLGASHASSVMDVVLGAFRYCINNPKNPDAAREMFGTVGSMMWGKKINGQIVVRRRGLIVRPEIVNVRAERHRLEYEALIAHLKGLLREDPDA